CQHPQLAFSVAQRHLTARAYLIATGSVPVTSLFATSSEEKTYLTLPDIWQQDNLESLPNKLLILGSNPASVELAQSFSRLSKKVILVIEEQRLLPYEDQEISFLLQAQLEAEGIEIFTQSPAVQFKCIDNQKWLQAGNYALEADEIIVTSRHVPNVANLNLEEIGVRCSKRGIRVNRKLQTTNPRIYACGDVLGGYSLKNIDCYEASLAMRNALFWPRYKVNYYQQPWVIFTEPNLARVGLTEAQARQHHGAKLIVVKEHIKNLFQAQISGETTGFCKLIVSPTEHLLGAHLIAPDAAELIGSFALAIQNKLKLTAIANLFNPSPTWSEIVNRTAQKWQQQKSSNAKIRSDYREKFLAITREWFF
ncbi:MAG: NAD(P)/FAD-dependent oxidoreductase, partial [Okeania sp. SIO2D1]|nr:NAD(P)/FAD-dependent oxidoreductase [Okeania sp. SIO2D1]